MRTLLGLAVVLALSACSDDSTEPSADPGSTVTVTATPPGPAAPTVTTTVIEDPEPDVIADDFPDDVENPEHGGRYFAVALATGEQLAIVESVRAVERHGYHAGVGELACLDGAAEAYGLPADAVVSYLLFADRRSAFRFADAYARTEDGTRMGVAKVRTYCLD